MANQFLSKDYKVPKVEKGEQFVKFEKDSTIKVRILTSPEGNSEGWVVFDKDNKPHRQKTKFTDEQLLNLGNKRAPKHFWSVVVWNHTAQKTQVLEVTQETIKDAIMALMAVEGYENPFLYDITIIRKDGNNKVSYQVVASPPCELAPEVQTKVSQAMQVYDAGAIWKGDYPFPY
jgi:hypothetical protein